jgi:hypothetical protein
VSFAAMTLYIACQWEFTSVSAIQDFLMDDMNKQAFALKFCLKLGKPILEWYGMLKTAFGDSAMERIQKSPSSPCPKARQVEHHEHEQSLTALHVIPKRQFQWRFHQWQQHWICCSEGGNNDQ